MTLDGITLFCAANELNESITGARIDKIFMPAKDELDILIRVKNENKRIKISANPNLFRLHLTRHASKNPDTPPSFCMFLRKYLTNATVENIHMDGLERAVFINILTRDEMGVLKPLKLILELMGKHSNIILTDSNNKVMECLKHVGLDVSRLRQILPSITYSPPPGSKLNPLLMGKEEIEKILQNKGQKEMHNHLSAVLQGLSAPTVQEMLAYISENYGSSVSDTAAGLADVFCKIKSGDIAPHIAADSETGKEFFSMLPYGDVKKRFSTVNELLDTYYFEQCNFERMQKQKDALSKLLKKHIDKREKRLQIQQETLEEAKQAEEYRKKGDLITANIYRLKKGIPFFEAADYYDENNTITINLDTRLSPSANAQKYYKRYNKLKSAANITKEQMEENSKELSFLYSEQISLQNCETDLEMEEILYELIKTGYYTEKKGQKIKQKEEASSPHAFLSSDGIEIYAGKNNRQNDLLTIKYAGLNDLWLHIKDFAGAHVIIKSGGKDIPECTLKEAAAIAAYLSRAKGSDKIPVDYTQRKNVKKPSGAKPGMVIYESYRTILIKPDEEVFNRLKVKKQ